MWPHPAVIAAVTGGVYYVTYDICTSFVRPYRAGPSDALDACALQGFLSATQAPTVTLDVQPRRHRTRWLLYIVALWSVWRWCRPPGVVSMPANPCMVAVVTTILLRRTDALAIGVLAASIVLGLVLSPYYVWSLAGFLRGAWVSCCLVVSVLCTPLSQCVAFALSGAVSDPVWLLSAISVRHSPRLAPLVGMLHAGLGGRALFT